MSGPDESAVAMMRHALGYGKYDRNYYCASIPHEAWSKWTGLVLLGLATAGRKINDGRDQYFHVSGKGRAYLAKLDVPAPDGGKGET